MSEEQLKALVTEATAQAEDGVEEISEEDLEGLAVGIAQHNSSNMLVGPSISAGYK